MLAVKGIYDGKTIQPLEQVPEKKRYKVIITFVEEVDELEAEQEAVRAFTAQDSGFTFWHDEREDLYQDFLPKSA